MENNDFSFERPFQPFISRLFSHFSTFMPFIVYLLFVFGGLYFFGGTFNNNEMSLIYILLSMAFLPALLFISWYSIVYTSNLNYVVRIVQEGDYINITSHFKNETSKTEKLFYKDISVKFIEGGGRGRNSISNCLTIRKPDANSKDKYLTAYKVYVDKSWKNNQIEEMYERIQDWKQALLKQHPLG